MHSTVIPASNIENRLRVQPSGADCIEAVEDLQSSGGLDWGGGVDVPVGSTKPTPPGTAVFPDWQQLVGMNREKELETPKQVGDEGCARKAYFK